MNRGSRIKSPQVATAEASARKRICRRLASPGRRYDHRPHREGGRLRYADFLQVSRLKRGHTQYFGCSLDGDHGGHHVVNCRLHFGIQLGLNHTGVNFNNQREAGIHVVRVRDVFCLPPSGHRVDRD